MKIADSRQQRQRYGRSIPGVVTLILMFTLAGCQHRMSRVSLTMPVPAPARQPTPHIVISAQTLDQADKMPVLSTLGEWRNLGPTNYAGKVYSIAVHPTDANVVYAAYGNSASLWRTRNGGQSWVAVIDRFRNPAVVSVAISLADQAVYAALGGEEVTYNRDRGVLRSRDGGDTWTGIGPASKSVWQVVPSSRDKDTVFAAATDGLWKTTDGGGTWASVLRWPDRTGADWIPDLELQPRNPDVMLLAQAAVGVMRSEDGGRTWVAVDQIMNQADKTTVLAWSVSDPNTVYAERVKDKSASVTTYRSTDAGKTWTERVTVQRFHQGRYDMSMAVDPADANHVLIANSHISESTDGLATIRDQTGAFADYSAVVFAPSNPQLVYAGPDQGLIKSADKGSTWARFDESVETVGADGGFAVDPQNRNIYLSARDYGVGIQFAANRRARDIPGFSYEYTMMHLHPLDRNLLFSGGEAYFLKSLNLQTGEIKAIDPDKNAGITRARSAYKSALAFHPTDPKNLYYGTRTVSRSANTGDTWVDLKLPNQADTPVNKLAVALTDPKTIYAVLDYGLFRSVDEGATWQQTPTALVSGKAVAIDPADPKHIFVGSGDGMFESRDGGNTLQPLGSGVLPNLAVNDIVLDPAKPARILLGSTVGVYISEDRGATWFRLGAERPILDVQNLVLAGSGLYASGFQGVWWMELNGARGCALPLYFLPTPVRFGEAGGETLLTVSASESCPWNLGTAPAGVRITTYEKTKGNGRLKIALDANTGARRDLALPIGGTTVGITQFATGTNIAVDGKSLIMANSQGTQCVTAGSGNVPILPCDNSDRQSLRIRQSAAASFFSVANGSGDCLDLANLSAPGSVVTFYPCHLQLNQQFELRQVADQLWQFASPMSGLCLSIADGALKQVSCDETQPSQTLAVAVPQATNAPALNAGGTLDAASFKSPVAPGSLAVFFGNNLGGDLTFATGNTLPTTLAGLTLQFGAFKVPLVYVSKTQVAGQIPWEVTGSSASLTASTAAGASAAVAVPLAPAVPSIFTTNQQGTGQAVIIISASGEVAAPVGSIPQRAARPVLKGEFLTIYCLGLGDVDNRPTTGALSPSAEPLARVKTLPTVTIGGASARVDFAGLAPGFVGLYQVNVQVPAEAPSGDAVQVVITVGAAASNTVTIAVQ